MRHLDINKRAIVTINKMEEQMTVLSLHEDKNAKSVESLDTKQHNADTEMRKKGREQQ